VSDPCEHAIDDRCEIYGIPTYWCSLCQRRPAYRELWEQGIGPGQEPSGSRPERYHSELILVLGIHRTLSSCLAVCLEKLGVWMGEQTNGGEDSKLAALCEQTMPFPTIWAGLMRENVFICGRKNQLRTWVDFHRQLADGRPVGMKYPTLCAWGEEFRRLERGGVRLKVIHLERPYWESVRSLVDRSQGKGRFAATPDECRRLQSYLDTQQKAFLEKRSYLTVRSHDLLRDPRHELGRVIDYLGLTPAPDQIEAAVAHVEPKKARHCRPATSPGAAVAADCQVLIKSFRRFRALAACVRSIRRSYPTLEILVADDSWRRPDDYPDYFWKTVRAPGVRAFMLPFDSGLAFGRNWLVEHASARYVLLADDDFLFTDQTLLERFVDVLNCDAQIDAVAGVLDWAGSGLSNWTGDLVLRPAAGGKQRATVGPLRSPWQTVGDTRYRRTDICWNFFLARRQFLLECPWDPQFKISREHLDWLLTVKQHGGRLAFTPQVIARHVRQTGRGYDRFRHRDNADLLLAKWNLVDLPRHNHSGELFSPVTLEGDQR